MRILLFVQDRRHADDVAFDLVQDHVWEVLYDDPPQPIHSPPALRIAPQLTHDLTHLRGKAARESPANLSKSRLQRAELRVRVR